MKKITARQRRAVDLVVNGGRTKASVGREFGVTAGTIGRWLNAIYTPPPPPPPSPPPSRRSTKPSQEMLNMYGWRIELWHKKDSPFPQKYRNLNSRQRRELREKYVEHYNGRCLYCGEPLVNEPHEYVRAKATSIFWPDFPGGKKGFLKNPIHLHHDHQSGLTLGPVHALCNAHSFHFHELPVRMQGLYDEIDETSDHDDET